LNKKIAILSQYFAPEMGAPPSRLYETARGLQRKGWEVRVYTAMPNYPRGKVYEAYRGKGFVRETIDGIPVYRYPIWPSNSPSVLPRIFSMASFSISALAAWFSLIRFRPDFLITESPPLSLGLTGWILSRGSGTRFLLNVSDLWPLSAYRLGAISEGYTYRRLLGLEKLLYRKADGCLGQSEEIVTHIKAHGGRRVHLFRNGVDLDRFAAPPVPLPANPGVVRLVYAGLLGLAQGILALCRSIDFARLGVEFHIYGEGMEKQALVDFLRDSPDRGIHYHGYLRRAEVPSVIKAYDLTLIPLVTPIYGAVPSKIYEAMAAGLPIVFAGGGEGARLIEIHELGWAVEPGAYEDMETVISRFARLSPGQRQVYRQRCLQAARMHFSRQGEIERLSAFLLGFEAEGLRHG